eukprot:GHVL01007949.1.p1 GENE.GHVL01007949.1~~GHVL01007949.1.p1  ORF type:complete len:806 (-),score=110.82 GHVL01007949.1:812-3229(-)
MGILRSQSVQHGTLVLPGGHGHYFLDMLGRSTHIQINDMNVDHMRRPYRRYIQRLEELERVIRYIAEVVLEYEPQIQIVTNKVENFLQNDNIFQLDNIESRAKDLYTKFVEVKENNRKLSSEQNELVEERYVLEVAAMTLQKTDSRRPSLAVNNEGSKTALLASRVSVDPYAEKDDKIALGNQSGIVATVDQERLARTFFRVSRGNAFTVFTPIDGVDRSVFAVFFQGSGTGALGKKIEKICLAFGLPCYAWPKSVSEAVARSKELTEKINDKQAAIDCFKTVILTEIKELVKVNRVGGNSLMEEWKLFCCKEKNIHACLNMFEGNDTLRADVWYPAKEDALIRGVLAQHNSTNVCALLLTDSEDPKAPSGHTVKNDPATTPPTLITTNEFTEPFQTMVDTYGVPRYREANPALFTIIAFPFLFGIMYGDIGHGAILFFAGSYLCFYADSIRKWQTEIGDQLLKIRFLITLMGFFSCFAGFIYNDFMSLPLPLFSTEWKHNGATWEPKTLARPYAFGLDPIWAADPSMLIFVNSFKMKFSVLVGVAQMILGIFLKCTNALHYRNFTDFFFEGIPQIIFMVCLFGYMDWMIIFKWLHPGGDQPGLINTMIDMCLLRGVPKGHQLYQGQESVQNMLLLAALIAVPTMLLVKPVILLYQNKKHQIVTVADDVEAPVSPSTETSHEFDFSEVCIMQLIETIEFVLGAVSNTASYLRLWALSLAHQQLSDVFFKHAILGQIVTGSTIGLFISYFLFALITVSILLLMDVLECFLHALRLQWVEFQNKFFRGDGLVFKPFTHLIMLTQGSN